MGITRPRFSQFDTSISSISDPITVLNKSSTEANVDVGFLINRNFGANSNVAIFWQESSQSFAVGLTSSSGSVNANVSVTSYANLKAGSIFVDSLYYLDGSPFSAGGGGGFTNKILSGSSNVFVTDDFVNVAIHSSNIASFTTVGLDITGNITADNLIGNVITATGTIEGAVYTENSALHVESDTSNIKIYSAGNIAVSSAGTANVLVVNPSGATILGNITADNLIGNVITATGTIEGAVYTENSALHVEANTSNIQVYSAGNITISPAGTVNVAVVSTTGISVAGNVTATAFIGDGSQLTGLSIPSSYTDSNVAAYLPTYTGNVSASAILTDNYYYANGAPFVGSVGGAGITGTSIIYVTGNGSASENGTELQNAYDTAKNMTPYNEGLSYGNRVTIIVSPGHYSGLVIDASYIDVVSLTGEPDVLINSDVMVSANNVYLKGLNTADNYAISLADGLTGIVCENCVAGDYSFGEDVSVYGTFINCTAGNYSFGGGNEGIGEAHGTFIDCTAGHNSFGISAATGVFTNCTGGQGCFAPGTGSSLITPVISGTFTNCTGGYGSFGWAYATLSGTFIDCKGGDQSFGSGGSNTLSGIFKNCAAGDYSFGELYSSTLTGTFINCTAGGSSFRAITDAHLYNCRLTSGQFDTHNLGTGSLTLCVDGNGKVYGGGGISGKHTIFVSGNGTAAANGTELINALYDASYISGRSSNNKVIILISPGTYDCDLDINYSQFDYIDLISLTGNRDVFVNHIGVSYAQGMTFKGIVTYGTDPNTGAWAPFTVYNSYCQFENCAGGPQSFGGDDNYSTGYYKDCYGASNSFGGGGNSGGVAAGTYINCTAGPYSFGGDMFGSAYGVFKDCTGGDYSFGALYGGASMTNCTGGYYSFLSVAPAGTDPSATPNYSIQGSKLYNCRLTSGSFQSPTQGGALYNCIDGSGTLVGGGGIGGTSTIFVSGKGNADTNGIELQNAYYNARQIMQNYPAYPTQIDIIISPGDYNVSSGLNLDFPFINLISLTGRPDVVFKGYSNDGGQTYSTGFQVTGPEIYVKGIRTEGPFTVIPNYGGQSQKFENCEGGDYSFGYNSQSDSLGGTFINCRGGYYSFGSTKDTAAIIEVNGTFINCTALDYSFGGTDNSTASARAYGRFENCTAGGHSFGGGELGQTTAGGYGGGTFIDCTAGGYSFGPYLASGTFTRCVAGESSFGGIGIGQYLIAVDCSSYGSNSFGVGDYTTYTNCQGQDTSFGGNNTTSNQYSLFKNCQGGYNSFGGTSGSTLNGTYINCRGLNSFNGTLNGTFENCSTVDYSGTYSSGFNGALNGKFINCNAGSVSFSGTTSGTFINCNAGNYSFGNSDTASGIFTNCTGADGSFGAYGVASGTFTNCTGGNYSFAASGSATGTFTNCTGGLDSFGGGSGGTLDGKLLHCTLTSGTFPTVTTPGRTVYCIDGNYDTNNQ